MVYFADKKSTIGFCFVSCYCIVVDDVNKLIGFHGNALPSRKLIKAALTPSKVTAPQDTHRRLVLQVYLGSKTLEFSAIHR